MAAGYGRDRALGDMSLAPELLMPGGLLRGGEVLREARFRDVNGLVEQRLAETVQASDNPPGFVTRALAAALERIGDETPGPEETAELCVADRRFLMLHLGALLEGSGVWLSGECEECGMRFDFHVDRLALPVVGAGPGYPFARVEAGGSARVFRLPNGGDQEAILDLDDRSALRVLLRRCLVPQDGCEPTGDWVDELGQEGIEAVDEALERVSPAVSTGLLTDCPDCGHRQRTWFDPYLLESCSREGLYREVHVLASTYHWSERQILGLPRSRRRLYLDLIDRSRGVHG